MQNIFKKLVPISISLLALAQVAPVAAFDATSTSFQILGAEIEAGALRNTSTTYSLIGVLGETATSRITSTSFTAVTGSATDTRCTEPVLTGVPGSGNNVLTWTASTCRMSLAPVANQPVNTFSAYEVCEGAASNNYSSCTNVAAVLTSTRTATSSVAMFYRIRVLSTRAGGTTFVAARSNELGLTAGGGTSGGGGGGGGGGAVASVASLTVGAPNGGEKLTAGTTTNITWSSTGSGISTIRLKLSGDGGLTFATTIATNESNDGTYTWTIPALTGSQFRVQVEGLNSTGSVVVSDISNDNFSIGPAGAVPEPVSAPAPLPTVVTPPRLAAPSPVNAVNVTLRGLAPPTSTVTVLRDGANQGFVTATSAGVWSMTLPNLTPGGLYTFVFQVRDSDNRLSATTTRTLSLPTNAPAFELENLLAPPTVEASKSQVQPGEEVRFFGQAAPGTTLAAEFNDAVRTLAIAGNGLWEMLRGTQGLAANTYSMRARVSLGTETSSWSIPVAYTVAGAAVSAPTTKSADISGDRRVNLTDFSRLVAFWQKSAPPANVDLNGDGAVNLKDLSILLHKWTG